MTDEQPGFFAELKRRKVSRVAVAYIVVAWVALQFLDLVLENLNAPDWVMQAIMALFAIGLPVALVLAWAFDITDEGIKATGGSNRLFTAVIALVSVVAVGFAAWSFLDRAPEPQSVADTVTTEEIARPGRARCPGARRPRRHAVAQAGTTAEPQGDCQEFLVPVQRHQHGHAGDW